MTRRCTQCQGSKDDEEFYHRPNGHVIQPCRNCFALRDRKLSPELAAEHNAKQSDRYHNGNGKIYHRKALRDLRRRKPEQYRGYSRRWAGMNQHRIELAQRAGAAVKRAIKKGVLVRPTECSACPAKDVPIEAAHADYSRPLDVRWLCRPCHRKWDYDEPKTA